jgi:hypothetical protein
MQASIGVVYTFFLSGCVFVIEIAADNFIDSNH